MTFSDTLAIVSIVLGIVALVVTTLGFFASLKFYRDGVELQGKAADALAKIEEKTSSIQTQIGGMFDKTLDAAISNKGQRISQNFDDISDQLEKSKQLVIQQTISQLKDISQVEKQALEGYIKEQFKNINDQVNISLENAEDIISYEGSDVRVSQFQAKILSLVRDTKSGISLHALSKRIGVNISLLEKEVGRLVRQKLLVSHKQGRYIIGSKSDVDLSMLDKAFSLTSKDGRHVLLAQLGQALKKLDGEFHPRNYGYTSLSEYIAIVDEYELIDNFVEDYNHPIVRRKRSA